MRLVDRIRADLKEALELQDKSRIQALRLVLSEIEYALSTPEGNHDVVAVLKAHLTRLQGALDRVPEEQQRTDWRETLAILPTYISWQESEIKGLTQTAQEIMHLHLAERLQEP